MSHKKRREHKKNKNKVQSENYNSKNYDNDMFNESADGESSKSDGSDNASAATKISDEDLEALRLLTLQLKGILMNYLGDTLLWNSTMEAIAYILEKYDGIDGNEHDTTLTPDINALDASYVFLAAKIVATSIGFTRFNIVSKKKAEGTFKYSLQPNYDINTANILNIIVSYYYIRAARGIVARDNTQTVFGL